MRRSDASAFFVFVLYAGSVGLSFEAAHSFSVFRSGELFFLGAAIFSGPVLMASLIFKESERLVVTAAHIFLALVFHPAVAFKDPTYVNTADQFEMLRNIHSGNASWWVRADMAYELSSAIKSDAILRLKILSPTEYWLFPPSVALSFWGIALFFYLPRLASRREKT